VITGLHGAPPCATTTRSPVSTGTGPQTQGPPCWTADPELFFAETPASVEAAKQLCAACPIRARCLAEAVDRCEPCGVWGGELFDGGAIVPRKRPRGRPRNVDRQRDAAWHAAHQLTSVA